MRTNKFLLAAALALGVLASQGGAAEDLARGFATPPASAKPWVYWFWLDGNITREGITADLEAMSRVGIGGVLIFEVAQGTPTGPVAFGSPQWYELYHFMLTEAHRLGLQVNMSNDAGWCGSGGPWITPAQSMQSVTIGETAVEGPRRFERTLPQPPTLLNYYRDIAVLAFPTPADDDVRARDYSPKLSAGIAHPGPGLQKLMNGRLRKPIVIPWPEPGKPQWVQVEFPQPFTARTVTLGVDANPRFGVHGDLQVSDDGRNFRTVGEFDGQPPEVVFNIPATTARWFRVEVTQFRHPKHGPLQIAELRLSPRFRLGDLQEKAAFFASQFSTPGNVPSLAHWPTLAASYVVPGDRIVDLTSKMNPDGTLSWDVPAGKWTILRIGDTPTGRMNHPAPRGGLGLESDKLSKEATRAMFGGLMGRIVAENGPLTGPGATLVSTHIDSWEVGSQNWTPRMREEFEQRRGYDPVKFLPVLTGRVVDTPEVTERFLWDLRLTVSELLRDNYAAEMRQLANQHGLRLSIEAYFGPPTNEIAYGGQADDPQAEFWSWNRYDQAYSCLEMTSAAHLYGRRIVGAESFTSNANEKWQDYPGSIKDLGDWALCEGINRFIFHRYAMQPFPNIEPGVSMGPWGLHYERTQTWWEQSRPWHEYLARCQYLLQQGLFVADICCLEPEGTNRFVPPASLRPANSVERPGYNFDGCPPEVLARMTVKAGRLVLPDGMSYRVLLLPDQATMTPRLLRRIQELVDAGATVIGPKAPLKSPSLSGYPQCDGQVTELARELWDGGKIVSGQTPAEYLAAHGVPPDFSSRNGRGEANIRFTHRQIGSTDVYFLANKYYRDEEALCSFRIQGRRPELWNPATGRIERIAAYDEAGGCIRVPIHFDPSGSVFVVFRPDDAVEPDRVTSVARDGRVILETGGPAAPAQLTDGTGILAGPMSAAKDRIPEGPMPGITVDRDDQGGMVVAAAQSGVYTLNTADGKSRQMVVAPLPPLRELSGPWTVSFDPKRGGPAQPVDFASLTDWTQRPEAGIRYYSGAAKYRTTFTWADPSGESDQKSRTFLDLGKVAVVAQVRLNGRDLGVLWTAPFSVELTGALRPGTNVLEVTVTNLWINRQIGDEQLPEDSDRDPTGFLKTWPQWVLDGQSSPAGRYSFTTWRLWKKDDPLAASGLLGPVVLRTLGMAR